MKTYTTIQGDMWDAIAYSQLGDVRYTDALMAVNPAYLDYYTFPAGVVLLLPELADSRPNELPPWKRART